METDCWQFTKTVLLSKELRWYKTDGQFHLHYVLYVDAKEDIWIADCENDKVEKFDSKGHFLSKSGNEAAKPISEFGKYEELLKNRKMDRHVHKNQISRY
ncbi:MAG: hypothetical protein ACE5SW_07005 [Nitrososphaeraceae archaeon]